MNVHHSRWLKHSSLRVTPDGEHLFNITRDLGLKQLVLEPTHVKGNLLDVVLSDVPHMCSVDVLAPVADHCVVHAVVGIEASVSVTVERLIWMWKNAA